MIPIQLMQMLTINYGCAQLYRLVLSVGLFMQITKTSCYISALPCNYKYPAKYNLLLLFEFNCLQCGGYYEQAVQTEKFMLFQI